MLASAQLSSTMELSGTSQVRSSCCWLTRNTCRKAVVPSSTSSIRVGLVYCLFYSFWPGRSNLCRRRKYDPHHFVSAIVSRAHGNQSRIWIHRYIAAGVRSMIKVTAPKSVAPWLNRRPKTKKIQCPIQYPNFCKLGNFPTILRSAQNWHHRGSFTWLVKSNFLANQISE